MKKTIIGALVLIIIVASISLKTKNEESSDLKNLKFGAIVPLTGQIAVLGERIRNGIELAREDVIQEYKLESFEILYQNACDSKTSIDAARKLVNVDKVKIISSSFCLFGIEPIIPILEEDEVLLFNTAANPEEVLNKKYVFSTNFTIRDDAYGLAEYAAEGLGAKTAAIIHLDTIFGESYKQNFENKFKEYGGELVESVGKSPDATDFRTDITKIKAKNPDVLIIIHFGSSLGNAIKQTRELGLQVPIMGDYESEDPTVITFAGEAAEGFIISSSQPEKESKEVVGFVEKYLERFGELPDVLAVNAYDAVRMQADAYIICNGDIECVVNKLESIKNYSGVSGSMTINPEDHSVEKPNVFKVVKDGEFIILKW